MFDRKLNKLSKRLFYFLEIVLYQHVVFPFSWDLKWVFDEKLARTVFLVFAPLAFIYLLWCFIDPESFFFVVDHFSFIFVATLIQVLWVVFGFAVFKLASTINQFLFLCFAFKQSVLLPMIVLQDSFVLPQRAPILSDWAQEKTLCF